MPPPTASQAKRALHPKEASLFKELLTLYETRQLKKGLKTADQILKKFPEHGGTFAAQPYIYHSA
jgi:N-alpha-acetyltransferase 15/16, NatA auxiliary subunit